MVVPKWALQCHVALVSLVPLLMVRTHAFSLLAWQQVMRALAEAVRTLGMQFPDPHFKNKHKKRRVVQPELVQAVAANMPPGGERYNPNLKRHERYSCAPDVA